MNTHEQITEKDHRVHTPNGHIYNISMTASGTWISHLFSPQSTITGKRSKVSSKEFGTLTEALKAAGIETNKYNR